MVIAGTTETGLNKGTCESKTNTLKCMPSKMYKSIP